MNSVGGTIQYTIHQDGNSREFSGCSLIHGENWEKSGEHFDLSQFLFKVLEGLPVGIRDYSKCTWSIYEILSLPAHQEKHMHRYDEAKD